MENNRTENTNRKKIAVLFGGCSTEYQVSLQSAHAVISNIDTDCYELFMIGIAAANGQWYLYRGNIDDIPEDCWLSEQNCTPVWVSTDKTVHGICFQDSGSIHTIPLDAAFPILHGKNGEDGTVQGLLELAGIPVIGCGLLSSAVGMDKELAHRIVSAAGIPTAATVTVTRPYSAEELMKCARRLGYPLFIKPVRAGSSFGITRVCEERELLPAVENAFAHDSEVVMEEEIRGFEVGCAVLGNEALTIGEVDEIELSEGFFNYEEKYTLKTSSIHVPARIPYAKAEEIRHAAAVIYRALKCRDFARIDMFLTPEGKIYFNEVNTIPGFTAHSRYPGMMKAAGIDFPELIRRLIEMGGGQMSKNYIPDPLVLINAEHPLFRPVSRSCLVPVSDRYPDILMEQTAAAALQRLLHDIGGSDAIIPVSGWRSHEEQQKIWKDTVADKGIEFTKKYVAIPGCSEHESGLAIDLAADAPDIDFICPEFPPTGICQIFREKAPFYGFIQRYPKGKEDITGISEEPWHFRYVGMPHSRIIAERGLVLEEYIRLLEQSQTSDGCRISRYPARSEKEMRLAGQEVI